MGETSSKPDWRRKPDREITIDIVIPVLNEAHVLERSIRTVHGFFSDHVPYRWRIVIAENGSTDSTVDVARRLCEQLTSVDLLVIGKKGRGRALRAAWSHSDADAVGYTDVDLSTELEAFPKLFDAILSGECDIAVGSRLAPESRTTRSFKRQVISQAYNQLLRWSLGVGFTDAQTGFKILTREVVRHVLPLVEDQSWFLDTELLVLAERLGYRIADIPVAWVEDDDSRVRIMRTAWEDIKGIIRVRRMLKRQRSAPRLQEARKLRDHEGPVH